MKQEIPTPEFLRISQIVGNKKTGTPALIPVTRSTWYNWIKWGLVPEPTYISKRRPAWRTEDVFRIKAEYEARLADYDFRYGSRRQKKPNVNKSLGS